MTIKIAPQFESLNNAETFTKHMSDLTRQKEAVSHERILGELLDQIEPVNYMAEAYPETIHLIKQQEECDSNSDEAKSLFKQLRGYKIQVKHLLIVTIECLIRCADKNDWGLCQSGGMVYIYNGAYWSRVEDMCFQRFLGDVAEKMGAGKFYARFYQFQEQLIKQFFTSGYLQKAEPANDTVCINLKNGTYEIKNGIGRLRPFDRNDFLTYQLPFEYDPSAKAPIFDNFLNEVLPDTSSRDVLSEYAGYVFIKNGSRILKAEKVLVLYGSGANGKSVFFEVLSALLGTENVSNFLLSDISNPNGYSRAELADKLVNYATEISGRMDTAIFKQMASGEPISSRVPYGRAVILRQYAKLIFNCNELPWEMEHTNAFFRRFLILPFTVIIPEERQDKNLHAKIIEGELSGVFNWILGGLNRLIAQEGFSRCDAANTALQTYKEESDTVLQFIIEQNYEKSANKHILLKDLYSDYRSYCRNEENPHPVGKKAFRIRLESQGIQITKINAGNIVYVQQKIYRK